MKRGYYRIHNQSLDVRRCPDASINCSDSPECPESTSGCRGTVQSSLMPATRRRLVDDVRSHGSVGCYDDLRGVFCRLCVPRDGKRVYYTSATASHRAHCRECHDQVRNILVSIGIAALVAFAVLSMHAYYVYKISDNRKAQLLHAWQAFTPHVKLKICIGFYMIAAKIQPVYEVCDVAAASPCPCDAKLRALTAVLSQRLPFCWLLLVTAIASAPRC